MVALGKICTRFVIAASAYLVLYGGVRSSGVLSYQPRVLALVRAIDRWQCKYVGPSVECSGISWPALDATLTFAFKPAIISELALRDHLARP